MDQDYADANNTWMSPNEGSGEAAGFEASGEPGFVRVHLIPVEKKLNLTIKEAAEYSNIGLNKINEMLRNPMCEFVLYVGNRKLVKRKEFEEYLSKRTEI